MSCSHPSKFVGSYQSRRARGVSRCAFVLPAPTWGRRVVVAVPLASPVSLRNVMLLLSVSGKCCHYIVL